MLVVVLIVDWNIHVEMIFVDSLFSYRMNTALILCISCYFELNLNDYVNSVLNLLLFDEDITHFKMKYWRRRKEKSE